MEKVKVEFFEAYPLIVLIYLLGANKFTLGDRQKLLVTFILNAMVNDELKIGSPELLAQVKKAFADLEDTELSAAFEFITSLKTLSSLVEDPLDVARLYSANYRSLRSITAQSKDSFKGQLMAAGTSETTALKIFDYAQGVDCWNEQLWLNLMYSRRADSIMIKPSSAAEIPTPVDETVRITGLLFYFPDTACFRSTANVSHVLRQRLRSYNIPKEALLTPRSSSGWASPTTISLISSV